MRRSYSQFGQDRWVVNLFCGRRNGFFIELGAGDGIYISNTLLLEREFGWTGILIEPTRIFVELEKNRPGCILDNSCVASARKKVNLFEVAWCQHGDNLLFSAVRDDIAVSEGEKLSSEATKFERVCEKEAVPLEEILDRHKAPKRIDYFSLDVEGSEYEILRNFPFDKYVFLCLGVERPPRELQKLLKENGYIFVADVFDFMYVHKSIGNFLLVRICILSFFVTVYRILRAIPRKVIRLCSLLLDVKPRGQRNGA